MTLEGLMGVLQIVFLGVVVIGGLAYMYFAERRAKRKRETPFYNRSDLSEEEFFLTYYRDTKIKKKTVSDVLRVISDATEIPTTKIRPSDRFDREFALTRGFDFDDGISEISHFLKGKMNQMGISEMPRLYTVDDLIRYVGQLETEEK
jgi:hypothetical protein